ncbi:GL21467 [Drosophila persimilis]|uniref:GL21467 n=1 Tax=Drosophila persimilis TaxID=7234 RepID=B4GDX8_DROPE|nr:ubiquilin-2 [Drosophila persimilis]EDW34639.1 GL21467 [Drosophila persimilis]
MSRENYIEIVAKSVDMEAIVSVRKNELIRNLRALVAVRFERAIDKIVLVFGGQVLRDDVTIDTIGITSGVNVHVVCRRGNAAPSQPAAVAAPPKQAAWTGLLGPKFAEDVREILKNPDRLKNLLKRQLKQILKKNGITGDALRSYLKTNRKVALEVSLPMSPDKLEYVRRRRYLITMRLELVPGGPQLLGRLDNKMRRSEEDNVARTYQQFSRGHDNGGNSQRGLENREPLPNPWEASHSGLNLGDIRAVLRQVILNLIYEYLLRSFREQLDKLLEMGYNNHRRNVRALVISSGCLENAIKLLDVWNR